MKHYQTQRILLWAVNTFAAWLLMHATLAFVVMISLIPLLAILPSVGEPPLWYIAFCYLLHGLIALQAIFTGWRWTLRQMPEPCLAAQD